MNFEKLENYMIDFIEEEQIKLGYQKEKIRLYYPLQSLNRILETELSQNEMLARMQEFAKQCEPRLGKMQISCKSERFCFSLPEEATEYVHFHISANGFLQDLIALVRKHGTTLEQVESLFEKYCAPSNKSYIKEKSSTEDFDYVFYFEDEKIDSYRYCFKKEGSHITYHRFSREDYQDFV